METGPNIDLRRCLLHLLGFFCLHGLLFSDLRAEQSLQVELKNNCTAVLDRFDRYTCHDNAVLDDLKNILEASFQTDIGEPIFQPDLLGSAKGTFGAGNYAQIWRGLESYPLEKEKACALRVADQITSIELLPAIIKLCNDHEAPDKLKGVAREVALSIARNWSEDSNLLVRDYRAFGAVLGQTDLADKWGVDVVIQAGVHGYLAVLDRLNTCQPANCQFFTKLLTVIQRRTSLELSDSELYELLYSPQTEVRVALAGWARALLPRDAGLHTLVLLLEDPTELVRQAALENILTIVSDFQNQNSQQIKDLISSLGHSAAHSEYTSGEHAKSNEFAEALIYMEPAIFSNFTNFVSHCNSGDGKQCELVRAMLLRWNLLPDAAYAFLGKQACYGDQTVLLEVLYAFERHARSQQSHVIDQLDRLLSCLDSVSQERFLLTAGAAASILIVNEIGANALVLASPLLQALSIKPESKAIYASLVQMGIGVAPFLERCQKHCQGDMAVLARLSEEVQQLKNPNP